MEKFVWDTRPRVSAQAGGASLSRPTACCSANFTLFFAFLRLGEKEPHAKTLRRKVPQGFS